MPSVNSVIKFLFFIGLDFTACGFLSAFALGWVESVCPECHLVKASSLYFCANKKGCSTVTARKNASTKCHSCLSPPAPVS